MAHNIKRFDCLELELCYLTTISRIEIAIFSCIMTTSMNGQFTLLSLSYAYLC